MRDQRRHPSSPPDPTDFRRPAERDRDRVLYSPALRRLSGITQTAAGEAGTAVHNRLTHVLEVSQIGVRLCQKLIRGDQRELAERLALDPDVVETACLAHDLGHPPFGHIAEDVLKQKGKAADCHDAFEGNAQSFRIVTRLEGSWAAGSTSTGLNLTRASLNAILKYPWARGNKGKRERKWNFYTTEEADFQWARALDPHGEGRKSPEAEIMDWADDIAYSIHDMEDFFQAGRIPLELLTQPGSEERQRFFDGVQEFWNEHQLHVGEAFKKYADAFDGLMKMFPFARRYSGDRGQRKEVKDLKSTLMGRYVNAMTLREPANASDRFVVIDPTREAEITMLKELTWHYVIRDPALATQQYGQQKIVRQLFDVFYDACDDPKNWHLLPVRHRESAHAERIDERATDGDNPRYRFVCDIISGMSEDEAVGLYRRIEGIAPGSAFTSYMR